MKESPRLIQEKLFIEANLGESIICNRCSTTLRTYASKCTAELSDPCPGFMRIEEIRQQFNQKERGVR